MAGIKSTGMKLLQSADSRKKDKSFILSILATVLACTTLILICSSLTGFAEIKDVWPALLAGCVFCIIYGILETSSMKAWFFPAALMLIFVFVLLMRTSLIEGFCVWWNRFSEIWTVNTGIVLTEFETGEASTGLMVFQILIGAIIGLISIFFVGYIPVLLPIVTMGILFWGMIVMHQSISFSKMCLFVVSGVFLLFYGGRQKFRAATPILIGWGMAVVLFVVFIPMASLDGMKNWAEGVSTKLHETIHASRYETKHTTLPEGRFSDFDAEKDAKQPALIVTGDNLEPMYLRGFTGAVFEDNRWEELDTALLADHKELLYWIQSNEFHLQSQFEKAADSVETEKSTVTIQNTGACSMYQYVPFNLVQGEYLEQDNLRTDSLLGDGERTYTFSIINGGADKIIQVLQEFKKEDTDANEAYRKAESAYRDFVYQYYVQLSDDISEKLKEEWDHLADSFGGKESLTFEQEQECVRTFLEKYFSEDAAADGTILPLESAAGTSYQNATAAVMTLRYFGIPARYAEGYIISEEMVEDSEGSIEVDSGSAGAWAEVYQDGIGWIPMVLTPGLEETAMNSNPDNKDENTVVIKDGEELEEEPEEPLEEPEPEGGTVVKVAQELLFHYLKYVLLLVLLVAAIILRRSLLLKKKEKLFAAENNSDAAAWIIADAVLFLEKMGFVRGNRSLSSLCTKVDEHFDDDYASEFRKIINLNSQALFSKRELDNRGREQAMEFRLKTLEHLKKSTKWYKRIWMKWMQCIY